MEFDGTEILIGKGAQADVVEYQGYAYKIYPKEYPAEWIGFEMRQQKAVNEAGLSPVRYYKTDDDHILKMDLIDGTPLEKYANAQDPLSFKILADAFTRVHRADPEGVDIPPLAATAGMGLGPEEQKIVLPIIERLSGKMKSCICHLDMHFLNIMIPKGLSRLSEDTEYTIIDWMNSRIAPAVFDYARTYVIFEEFSVEAVAVYKDQVLPQMWELGVKEEDFADAVKACFLMRQREKN